MSLSDLRTESRDRKLLDDAAAGSNDGLDQGREAIRVRWEEGTAKTQILFTLAAGMAGGSRQPEPLRGPGKRYLGVRPGRGRPGYHAPGLAGAKRSQAAYAGRDLQLPVYGEAALHHGAE